MTDSRFTFYMQIVLGVVVFATLGLLVLVWTKADDANRSVQAQAASLRASAQSPTHVKDIAIWCDAINAERNYERQYTTGTVKQSESEAQTIDRAISNPNAHGLTSTQAAFIRLYLGSVVALEREAPQTLSLHLFTLGDLNCKQIEAGAAAASKSKP